MPTRKGAGTEPKEMRQDSRGELGLGRGLHGPSQVSRPQMKGESLVPPEGSSQSLRKSLFLYMSDLFHIRSDILTHIGKL